MRWVTTNGQAGAILRRGDTLLGMVTVVASEDGIEQLLWIMNPDKMTAMATVTK